jgi:ribosomal protein L22
VLMLYLNRGKKVAEAIRFLNDVLKFKRAVTFTKFTGKHMWSMKTRVHNVSRVSNVS